MRPPWPRLSAPPQPQLCSRRSSPLFSFTIAQVGAVVLKPPGVLQSHSHLPRSHVQISNFALNAPPCLPRRLFSPSSPTCHCHHHRFVLPSSACRHHRTHYVLPRALFVSFHSLRRHRALALLFYASAPLVTHTHTFLPHRCRCSNQRSFPRRAPPSSCPAIPPCLTLSLPNTSRSF
jgi:hypothetical protein